MQASTYAIEMLREANLPCEAVDVNLLAADIHSVAEELDSDLGIATKVLARRISPAPLESYLACLRIRANGEVA